MLERFTPTARASVLAARHEAERRGEGWIGTEHLLIAFADAGGTATEALAAADVDTARLREALGRRTAGELDAGALATIGIDLDHVRRTAEAEFGPGALDRRRVQRTQRTQRTPRPRFTRRAKKLLELGLREATRLHASQIDTGHLLLGLLREGSGLGARLLGDVGVSLPDLRADVEARSGRRAA